MLTTDRDEVRGGVVGEQSARVAGYILFLAFFALGATSNGLKITFHDSQTTSSPGELNFWLGHAFLLFPASLLIGYGFGSRLGRMIQRAAAVVEAWTPRERTLAIAALTGIALAAVRIGRAVFLLDLPITDDEYAVEFGGRILASGHLMTRLPLLREAVPDLFLYFRDGAVGSFDWPGGIAISAIGELTRLRTFVWTLAAVAPVPVLAVLMRARFGAIWGFAAAVVFLCSPMSLLMSMTTHAQLGSRALLALGLLALDAADRHGGFRRWGIAGLMFGLAFLCRPLEIAFFCTPLALWAAWQTWRGERTYRTSLPGLALGFAACAAVLLWHSHAMTGSALLPARFANPANTDVMASSLWTRFGDNVTYNLMMLAIWFLGPLGVALVAAGVLTDRFTRLLGACVAADLCLAFFHDNPGLHIVGPIHYSECAVPLTVLATCGLSNVIDAARRHRLDVRPVASMAAVALVLGLGTFTLVQALALRDQAAIQRTVYGTMESAVRTPGEAKAVVLTPWFFAITSAVPRMRDTGSWVHDWRRPQLGLDDDVLFLRDVRGGAEATLRDQLPGRRFFRVARDPRGPYLTLVPLSGGAPIPLPALGEAGR